MTQFQHFALGYLIHYINESDTAKNAKASYQLRENDRIELVLAPHKDPGVMIPGDSEEGFRFYFKPEFVEDGINFIPEDSSIIVLEFRAELGQMQPSGPPVFVAMDAVDDAKRARMSSGQ